MTMAKELIIFDADGTLLNTNHLFVEVYDEAFRWAGRPVDRALILSTIGMGHDQAIPRITSPEWYEAHGARVVERAESLFLKNYLKRAELFSDAIAVVSKLKSSGKQVALASSSQRVIVNHYLTLFPDPTIFSAVVTFDDVTHSKPHPELFLRVLDTVKVTPQKACTVGDSTWDMQASGRAGLDAVAVLSGGTPRDELLKYGAREIYQDVSELYRALDRSFILK